jgi:hypothetical protein
MGTGNRGKCLGLKEKKQYGKVKKCAIKIFIIL